eukprot:Em0022g116a
MAEMSEKDSPRGSGRRGQPTPFTLTEEEKSVLLECRRNSIARGIPLGIATVIALRFFIRSGMAPFHVQRWSSFYYTGGFLLSFMAGVGSYREKCFQKIMALENSTLKQQVKERFSSQSPSVQQDSLGKDIDEEPVEPRSPRRRRVYKESRLGSAPGQGDDNGSGDIPYGPGSQGADMRSQESGIVPGAPVEQTTPTKRSRTFEEIRQENRRKLRQRAYEEEPSADEGDTWRRDSCIIWLTLEQAKPIIAAYCVSVNRKTLLHQT